MPMLHHANRRPLAVRALERAQRLLNSGYGRNDGWDIELDGRVVGQLSDPRFEDMFWFSYAVTAENEGGGDASPIADYTLWGQCRFRFRSQASGTVALHPFPGGGPPFVRDGRVLMRALYVMP